MPTRFRKVRRLRGSRTHSYGQVGQHRKSGSRGGRGLAGLHKHKWTWTVKYDPEHFGGMRFRPPGQRSIQRWMNVGQLDELSASSLKNKPSIGEKMVLNLREMGYAKLLGEGSVKGSYKVIVDKTSAKAKEKVEAAGGELVAG